MKKGWTYKKLGEVGSFQRGGGFLKKDYVDHGFPCIHYGQIHMKMGTATNEHLTSIPYELVPKVKIASKGDVIFAITSEDVEGSCKCTAWIGDYDVAVGGHTAIYKHNMNPVFVSYFVQSPCFQKAKRAYTHGFKVVEIKPSDIAKITIPVPSLSEQQRIVSYLDTSFAHLDELKANAEKQVSEARALFQKALAKAMEPKEGWEEKTLGEITIKIGSGATPRGGKKVYINEGTALVRSMNVHNYFFKYDDLAHINENASIQLGSVELKLNDVLFNITGASIARCCLVPQNVLPARVNQHVAIIRPIVDLINPQFLCLLLLSACHQEVLLSIGGAGSTRQAITKADLENHIIHFPPLSTQQRIVEHFDSLSAHVKQLEENQQKVIAECDALKQSILRNVFEE